MEALISIALCCTTITSIGDYMIWYDNENDSLKSLLTYESKINNAKNCINYDNERKDSKNYIENLKNISWLGEVNEIKKINNNYCVKKSCSI